MKQAQKNRLKDFHSERLSVILGTRIVRQNDRAHTIGPDAAGARLKFERAALLRGRLSAGDERRSGDGQNAAAFLRRKTASESNTAAQEMRQAAEARWSSSVFAGCLAPTRSTRHKGFHGILLSVPPSVHLAAAKHKKPDVCHCNSCLRRTMPVTTSASERIVLGSCLQKFYRNAAVLQRF